MNQIVKKDTLPESDEYGEMIYHAPSRTLRIFKNGSYKDFTAFEFIHDGEMDMDGDDIPDYLDPDLEDGPLADPDGDGVINLIDKFDYDSDKSSGNDEDSDGVDDEFDNDDDGDGILDIYDSDHPDNDDKTTGEDIDGDNIDDGLDPDLEDGPLADPDGDGVINDDDLFDYDSDKASGNDEDDDGVDDEFDNDDDGDGILDIYDSDHPDNEDKITNQDIDGDNIDDGLDPDLNDGPEGDLDGDGTLNKDDTDKDNDGYDDEEDYDPDNPFVWSGDDDEDGTDSEIDPDDNNPEITIARESFEIVYDYNFAQSHSTSLYNAAILELSNSPDILLSDGAVQRRSVNHTPGAEKYSRLTFPPEAQGQFVALIMATTTSPAYSDHIVYNNTEQDLNQLGRKLTTFFRVSTTNWSGEWDYYYNIVCMPYYDKNNQFLSNPIEWNGYYPLYQTQQEANSASPQGDSHLHTFNWNAGELGTTANVARTFYMPNGLVQATSATSKRKYATHFWHGNHPGLDVFSQILSVNGEAGAYDWDKTKDYTSTNTPSVALSDSLKTLKEGITVT